MTKIWATMATSTVRGMQRKGVNRIFTQVATATIMTAFSMVLSSFRIGKSRCKTGNSTKAGHVHMPGVKDLVASTRRVQV